MTKVKLSRQADRDLAEIFVYTIETFGRVQAERYLAELDVAFEIISRLPRIGRRIDGVLNARRLVHGSHIIFYQGDTSGILILSVKHGRRRDADKP